MPVMTFDAVPVLSKRKARLTPKMPVAALFRRIIWRNGWERRTSAAPFSGRRLMVLGLAVCATWTATSHCLGEERADDTKPDGCAHMSALALAIDQNTRANNQVNPAGVPASWSWYGGKSGTSSAGPAPTRFSAVTGWGIVYPQAHTQLAGTSARILIDGFVVYVHLAGGGWAEVQNQARDTISGGNFVADFSRNAHIPWTKEAHPDGSVSVDAPRMGYNAHFWPFRRGTFTPDTVDGVFVQARLKTDDPLAALVAALGADWWRDAAAPYVDGFSNNPGVGQSNFVKLTTGWQKLFFYSLSTRQLVTDPPPNVKPARPARDRQQNAFRIVACKQ